MAVRSPKPRNNILGAALMVILVPTVKRYMPRIVGYPMPVNAWVKPPILSKFGKNVLITMPRNSGTTIIPPGTRLTNL